MLGICVQAGCFGQPDPRQGSSDAPARAPNPGKTPGAARTEKPLPEKIITVTVAPGVHVFIDLLPSPVHLVETANGFVLIDTSTAEQHEQLVARIKQLGYTLDKLRGMLLTHAHGDHSLGAMRLKRETGAAIYAGAGDAEVLRKGGPYEAIFSKYSMPGHKLHPTDVDVELHGDEVVKFDDVEFRCISTPGHTPGSMCYLLVRDKQRILYAGDMILTPFELGTYSTYLPPGYRGVASDYCASIRKLMALEPPDILLPGHPDRDPRFDLKREPRYGGFQVKPGDWESLLARGLREMEIQTERLAVDGADFLDGVPKQIESGLFYLGEVQDLAVYAAVIGSKLVIFDAPGGDEIVAFLKSRLPDCGFRLADVRAVLMTSCLPQLTAGLRALVSETECEVVAAEAAREFLQKSCPEGTRIVGAQAYVAADDTVRVLEAAGPQSWIVMYAFHREERKVLISGEILIGQSLVSNDDRGVSPKLVEQKRLMTSRQKADADRQIWQYLTHSHGDPLRFEETLERLRSNVFQVWLPARHGRLQNANLYDDDWLKIVERNQLVLRDWMERVPREHWPR